MWNLPVNSVTITQALRKLRMIYGGQDASCVNSSVVSLVNYDCHRDCRLFEMNLSSLISCESCGGEVRVNFALS